MNDKIHVVYVRSNILDDYNRHTAASMVSVLENCSKPVVFHVIHEPYSDNEKNAVSENIKIFREIVEKYSSEIIFHSFSVPKWMDDHINIWALQLFPRILLSRFYLPNILPNINRVVSLGSDVIVKTDLAALLDLLPNDKSVLGVLDTWMGYHIDKNKKVFQVRYGDYAKTHGMHADKQLCPDVMLFNLEYIRNQSLLPNKAIEFLQNHDNILLPDQDVLNAVLYDTMSCSLPLKFSLIPVYNNSIGTGYKSLNQIISTSDLDNPKGYILHYVSEKPWGEFHSEYDFDYWYYLSKTPWGTDGKCFDYMKKIMKTPQDIIDNLDNYVWGKSFQDKIKICITLPFVLYRGLICKYWHRYIKKDIP